MSVVSSTPAFSVNVAQQFANEYYALHGRAEPLPSYQDQNFVIVGKSGRKYVLKIANAAENRAVLEAQNQLMEYVSEAHEGLFPYVLESLKGTKIEKIEASDGQVYLARMLTYLDGTPMGEVKRHSRELMFDLGQKLGILNRSLQNFDHPALHRDFEWDLANGLNLIREKADSIDDKGFRELVKSFGDNFESRTAPLLPALRKSTIYNDANEYNILLGGGDDIFSENQSVTGFIDLGDVMFGLTVGDLAIAIAYAVLDKPQPLSVAAEIVKGYHSAFPLTKEEISALSDLVAMRMCMSACVTAEQRKGQPDNDYLVISQRPIRNTLPKWLEVHPRFAESVFRHACGLVSFAASSQTENWLRERTSSFAQILPVESPLALDLSIESPLLHGDVDENTEPKLTRRITELLEKADAMVGIGQYDEARYIYTSPAFQTGTG
ncbi:MAG: phosphotransferase, partial [Anaerolineales bacterium]|nr:phosphotransferase [Anaerolineales bacterium]